ncbi:glycosyl hydrolase family 28-related protein [Cupriavidus sp. WKF15]|uniref:right-handed parallel beta-helix repeat-containing protein n=1 Tax=Cupriavidus sp. WKF15 TaxID=3032282 RepID=UPI0023E345E6|nr:right-handed parallel beta-helix repeat-containing protein [Cupriavidus sp. WKF15]WER49561.1 glycosyl hydrolase family 28-related protein [Cupriavidus sp. WKF15]
MKITPSQNRKTSSRLWLFVTVVAGCSFPLLSNFPQTGFQVSARSLNESRQGSGAPSGAPSGAISSAVTAASGPAPTASAMSASAASDPCPLLTAEKNAYPGATVKAITAYGARGDGSTDDYVAFQRMASEITNRRFSRRQIIYFPKGTYYINRYAVTGGPEANKIRNVQFLKASNFSLIGCTGSVVSFKGDFTITNDYNHGGSWYSYKHQLGFEFRNSSNFKVSGLEIYGNVDKMSRPPAPRGESLSETSSQGIQTNASSNYELSHLKVHHFACDGLFIGGEFTADLNGTIHDVDSYNNARQGMSIMQARSFRITNSSFRNTGITGGSYPTHAPAAGVDIEPDGTPADGVTARTGNIVFDACRFLNNKGSQFVGGDNGRNTENVTIRNSQIVGPAGTKNPYVVILSAPGSVIENNDIDTADGGVYPAYSEGVGDMKTVNTIVRKNTIRSSGVGLQAIDAGARIVIEGNTFISTHKPGFGDPYPNISAGVASFSENKLSYPRNSFGSRSVVGVIKASTLMNNSITTDLTGGNYTIRVGAGANAANNDVGAHIRFAQ